MVTFVSNEAHTLWTTCAPCRIVNKDLGYPVLECDEEGNFIIPKPLTEFEISNRIQEFETKFGYLKDKVLSGWVADVYNDSENAIAGTGVFANQQFNIGDFIGCYCGTVYTESEWDDENDENFLFNLNDGANGVVLDGSTGDGVNQLKYINHSCTPNIEMVEVFFGNSWYIVVRAITNINIHDELCHDFALHTEEEALSQIPCLCNSISCRKFLYKYYPW